MKKLILAFAILPAAFTTHAQTATTVDTAAIINLAIKEYPVLFHQTAAEYRALCYQAFNIARVRLEELPRKKLRKGHLAIITDLDETILDNSYSEAQLIKQGRSFTGASWKDWLSRSAATEVPGAVAFLQLAASKGITIFYISNREVSDVPTTLLNLQRLQLPNADTMHMIFKSTESSKESRRQRVAAQYEVVMLLGDNLTDFMNVFESRPIAARFAETDRMREEWGKKFIVLPNAIYGEWENAIYDYKSLNPSQKEAARKEVLKGY